MRPSRPLVLVLAGLALRAARGGECPAPATPGGKAAAAEGEPGPESVQLLQRQARQLVKKRGFGEAGLPGDGGGPGLPETGSSSTGEAAQVKGRWAVRARAMRAGAPTSNAHSPASGRSWPSPKETAAYNEALLARMAADPTDLALQAQGCWQLGMQLGRDSGPTAAPILSALDGAVESALAASPPNLTLASECLGFLIGPAVFNRPFTLMLNRSTHTIEHIVRLLKMYPDNAAVQEQWLQCLAGAASYVAPELTPVVEALGGFDVLFDAIARFRNDPDVMMSAWRGLSDHSHNPRGAAIIANHGGPMKGIDFLVEELRVHPQPYLAESPYDHLTLKYEIMQLVNGLLENDGGNVYGSAFVRAGLIPQMLYAMRVEPDKRGTQDVACNCMQKLLAHDATVAVPLAESGAEPLLVAAVLRFQGATDDTAWCGTTLGQAYPVAPTCEAALGLLSAANLATNLQMSR